MIWKEKKKDNSNQPRQNSWQICQDKELQVSLQKWSPLNYPQTQVLVRESYLILEVFWRGKEISLTLIPVTAFWISISPTST